MEKWLSVVSQHRRIAVPVAAVVVLLALTGGVAAATGALTDSTSPTATPGASTSTTPSRSMIPGFPAAGGADNIVQVINHTDRAFKSGGRDKVSQINGPNVGPKNQAFAFSSCTNCSTVAIALQIVLRNANANNVQPQNAAVAVNYQCTGCVTCAIAIQDVIPVADPTQIPVEVRQQATHIDAELRDLQASATGAGYAFTCPGITDYANAVVLGQLQTLAGAIDVKRDVQTAPTTPGASPMASPSPTVSGSPTESATATPQPSSTTTP
jgi:putative peptide zinc metalloprotease protein